MKNQFKIGDIVKIVDDFPFRREFYPKKLHRTVIEIDGHSIYLDEKIGNYDRYHHNYFIIDEKQTRLQKLKNISKC